MPTFSPYARPGPYITTLTPQDEQSFEGWVQRARVPFDPSPQSDYDMRGYWQQQTEDPKNFGSYEDYQAKRLGQAQTELKTDGQHFTDEFKTPYHKTFSNESRYALPNAPHWDDRDRLIDEHGKMLADEGNLKIPPPTPYRAPQPLSTTVQKEVVRKRKSYGK